MSAIVRPIHIAVITLVVRSCLWAAAMMCSVSAASAELPDVMIARLSRQVLDIAAGDTEIQRGNRQRILEAVERVVLPHIDFERMTISAAGRFWRQATPRQQRRLTAEFRALLVHVYSGALAQAADKEIIVRPLHGYAGAGEATVYTEVVQKRGAEPVKLNYRLASDASGWKIQDVSVMGVWLVQTYRSSFANEIRRSGIDGLIEKLAEKNQRLAADGATAR